MHSSKIVAPRSASQAQAGSIKPSHSFRRYLHIEAVFVFEAGAEHWSPRQAGRPFRIAYVREGQFDAEPHLHGIVFTLGVGEALAQATMAQQEACQPDVFRLCGSDILDESSHACAATNPG